MQSDISCTCDYILSDTVPSAGPARYRTIRCIGEVRFHFMKNHVVYSAGHSDPNKHVKANALILADKFCVDECRHFICLPPFSSIFIR